MFCHGVPGALPGHPVTHAPADEIHSLNSPAVHWRSDMARYLFFRTSRSAYEQVTELFDFVWSTNVSLWNLRWQVKGFADTQSVITESVLNGRFVAGSGIRGANLSRACLEMTWEEQQSQFAKFLLFDLFAIIEGWLAKVLDDLGRPGLAKEFQFPTSTKANGTLAGFGFGQAELRATPSPLLTRSFYPGLRSHPKNSLNEIEKLLIAYRCFKECRNAVMHAGGIAQTRTVSAYQAYLALTASDLRAKELPECPPVLAGNRVQLSLRGVVGFSDVILRLIATLDAEFACALHAEKEFRSQWLTYYAGARSAKRYVLSTTNASRRDEQIGKLVRKLGLPTPSDFPLIESYLRAEGLVH